MGGSGLRKKERKRKERERDREIGEIGRERETLRKKVGIKIISI